MKKLIGIALGLLLVLSFANASTIKVTKKTGTYEFFGVAKNIEPTGLGLVLGASYIANDNLTFTIPSDFKFKTPNASYFLVLKTGAGGTYRADANNNGTLDWQYLSGGFDAAELRFRLVDAAAPGAFVAGRTWFICTVAAPTLPAGSNVPILIQVPIGPGDSYTTGKDYSISSYGTVGGTATTFDPGTGVAFFTAKYEYKAEVTTAVSSTIDVAQERKKFLPTGTTTSAGEVKISRNTADYQSGPGLTATDYFRHTITGSPAGAPMQAVKYVQCFMTSNNTPVVDTMTVDVPGNYLYTSHAGGGSTWAGTNRIAVTGTAALSNRVNTVAIDLVPSSTFKGRTILAATTGWTWTTNGTLFRTSWFATARNAGYVSAIRIANDTTLDAKVYADVYLDDGQKTTESMLVGTILAKGMWAMDAYDLCVAAGLHPSADVLGPSSKGRIFLTVWSLPDSTFGHLIYTTPLGTTQMPLEKWTTSTASSWWEK